MRLTDSDSDSNYNLERERERRERYIERDVISEELHAVSCRPTNGTRIILYKPPCKNNCETSSKRIPLTSPTFLVNNCYARISKPQPCPCIWSTKYTSWHFYTHLILPLKRKLSPISNVYYFLTNL